MRDRERSLGEKNPKHPYTQELIQANDLSHTIRSTPRLKEAPKDLCPYLFSCKSAMEICCKQEPLLFGKKHEVLCYQYDPKKEGSEDVKTIAPLQR